MKIEEAALDPKWEMGMLDIGGGPVPVLTIEHPRLGLVCMTMTRESLAVLVESAQRILEAPHG